jgi:uracil-DNA glycosylase
MRKESKKEQLQKIEQEIKQNLKCDLKDASTNLVFGKGNPNAKIMFIGEAPGKKEDLEGQPFVGAAGKKLDELLKQINLTINDVYIANILKYRPPQNRNPQIKEIKTHTPYLLKQIQIIKPKIICTLGNFSTKFALAGFKTEGMNKIPQITQIHGKPQIMNKLKIIPLYHPAAMLYNSKLKDEMQKDFKKLKETLTK